MFEDLSQGVLELFCEAQQGWWAAAVRDSGLHVRGVDPGARRARYRQWRDEHPEEARAENRKRVSRQRQRMAADPSYRELVRARKAAWRARHPDYLRQWRQEHPELVKGQNERQRLRRKARRGQLPA